MQIDEDVKYGVSGIFLNWPPRIRLVRLAGGGRHFKITILH